MHVLRLVALVLVIVGALNWGLIGLAQWNLVEAIFGAWPMFERTIYVIVGLAAVVLAALPDTWRRQGAMA
jgi:uncharacterized membrane protein YuzA (DUF378 family)